MEPPLSRRISPDSSTDGKAATTRRWDRLIPIVYEELRVIASRHVSREWRPGAFQTTALVNEAYLKLVDQRRVHWQNRAHFLGLAAQLMRRILVDDARRRLQAKHGGGAVETPIDGLPLDGHTKPGMDEARASRH